jgi:hypothetical protein
MRLVGPYLDGGSPYWLSPPCGVVLSAQRGAGIASDRTEVTIAPSVLAGLKRRACSWQSRHAWLGSISPHSLQGSGRWRDCASLARHAAKTEGGVAVDLGLGVWPGSLGSAKPRSFWPSPANTLWVAWPVNKSVS